LIPLPKQPDGLSWPTASWPKGEIEVGSGSARFDHLIEEVFNLTGDQGVTYGVVIIKSGKLVYERYAAGASAMYLQYSWSMAKSVTHALMGILVREGKIDIYDPAPVEEWQQDDRRHITIDHLLRMSSGLRFNEDYIDGQASDVIPMLSYDGRHDTGAYAAAKPLIHPPGSHWSYSSGTTNILCRIIREALGGGATEMLAFMREELFEPLGMRTAFPRLDDTGTFIGSSFLFATPQDFARFGYLYLRGGQWQGQQILPADWVDYARSPTYLSNEEGYGAHWWIMPQRPDWFYASGYDGQRILVVPEADAIIVRCGRTPTDEIGYVWERINQIAEML